MYQVRKAAGEKQEEKEKKEKTRGGRYHEGHGRHLGAFHTHRRVHRRSVVGVEAVFIHEPALFTRVPADAATVDVDGVVA